MTTQRPVQRRAKTTPTITLNTLLTSQEAAFAIGGLGDDDTNLQTPRTPGRKHRRGPPPGILLQKWDELPAWQQDNHFIWTSYRPESQSYTACFQSLFYLHNEWVNIHTHLLGSFLFFCVGICVVLAERVAMDGGDVLAFATFFASAVFCLGVSAGYHCVCNHSPEVCRWGGQVDYVGIVALIMGSFIPSVYYGFHCEPFVQKVYWVMISTIGAACITVSVKPKFRTPHWRPFRTTIFIAMGLSGVFPVIHGISLYGMAHMIKYMGLPWLALQGFLYVAGGLIYAIRIPERLKPGYFDVYGSSHQVFHVLILLAAMSHLIGLLNAFHHNKQFPRCTL